MDASPPSTVSATSPEPSPTASPATGWRPTTFRALRHRNYRLYFCGQLISFTGSWLQTTALQWLAYQLTEQSQWTALISTATILPAFVFGVWGGVLADRLPKRGLIFVAQALMMVQSLLLALLVFLGWATPGALLGIALVLGFINAVDLPARLAFVTDLVSRDDLVNAVALNSLIFNLARVVGPWMGGLLLSHIGATACFLTNGLTFVAMLAGLSLMKVPPSPVRESHAGWRVMLGGWRHLAGRPTVAILILMTGLLSTFAWPYLTLLPALAHRTLGDTAAAGPAGEHGEDYSQLLAGMGCGALLAALTLATLTAPHWRRLFLGLAILAAAAGLGGLALVGTVWAAVGCCALVGFGLVLFNATSQSVIQLSADDTNRGQVMGVWSMVISGALPLGNSIVGPAADHWGVSEVLLVQAFACLGAGVVMGILVLLRRSQVSPLKVSDTANLPGVG